MARNTGFKKNGMTRDEMVTILEEIARDERNVAARVAALRLLEEWRKEEEAEKEQSNQSSDFDRLYEFAPRPRLQVKDGGKVKK
jgi:hypothetical protein